MSQTARWYPCACGAEHDTPTCPFGAVGTFDLDEATPILGAEIAKLKALAVDPSAIPADLVRISRPSPVGQSPAALTAPATGETLKGSDQ